MKYYGKRSLSGMLNIILSLVIIFGIALTCYTYYITFINSNIGFYKKIIAIILLTVGIISTFTIIIELKRIIKSLVLENPFSKDNVKALKRISNGCFIISACYIINFIINIGKESFQIININISGIHTDAEFFIFLLAGSFIMVLAKVFEQAVKYKEENDLTI